jgi:hypothetical protein
MFIVGPFLIITGNKCPKHERRVGGPNVQELQIHSPLPFRRYELTNITLLIHTNLHQRLAPSKILRDGWCGCTVVIMLFGLSWTWDWSTQMARATGN